LNRCRSLKETVVDPPHGDGPGFAGGGNTLTLTTHLITKPDDDPSRGDEFGSAKRASCRRGPPT